MRKYIKKPSGYFWRFRKKIKSKVKQGDTIFLNDYKKGQQKIIITLSFSDLPYGIKII